MTFDELGLSAELLRAVADEGYTEPTPVQSQAIPPILAGQDVMAGAQTGTGKTAAFVLPMLHRFKQYANTSVSPARHPVRALIIAPTRELAAQVFESVRTYGKHIPLRASCVYGGVNIDPQMAELRAGVEILVATPGRLLDHVHQRTVNLGQVEILVLDEADRMLDMGFMPDIKRIIALLPAKRQNLMFSATFPDDIKRLADQILKAPVRIQVAKKNTVTELVSHSAFTVDTRHKREVLERLMRERDLRQVLCFTSTKISANRLARELTRDGFACAALHSDKTQQERMQALADFKDGKVQVLVATDIAARGLDIEQLPLVINYELPPNAEDYIHRLGRTGRAGVSGEAISLVARDEQELLSAIEKLLKAPIPISEAPENRRGAAPPSQARPTSRRSATAPDHRRTHAPAEQPDAVPHAQARTREQPRSDEQQQAPSALVSKPGSAPTAKPARKRQVAALFLPPAIEKQDN
jgi:ATP-dependent RNA helicase RhlE